MYSIIFWKLERPKANFVVGQTIINSSQKWGQMRPKLPSLTIPYPNTIQIWVGHWNLFWWRIPLRISSRRQSCQKVDHTEDNDHIDDADYIEDDDHFEGNLELMTIRGARGCLAKKPHLSLQPIATLHCPHSIRIYVMFFLEADNSNTVFVNTFGW